MRTFRRIVLCTRIRSSFSTIPFVRARASVEVFILGVTHVSRWERQSATLLLIHLMYLIHNYNLRATEYIMQFFVWFRLFAVPSKRFMFSDEY